MTVSGRAAPPLTAAGAEVQVRGRPPVMHLDFRRQYAMVFLLQGLQELLSAERLEFVEDTATVREFVKGFTPDELYRLETYRKLNVLCWVKAAGEMLPVRAAFKEGTASGADQFSLAITPRHSVEPVPLWLADVIAAKLEHPQGRSPEVICAERIVPIGRQTLRKTRLFGDAAFDPRKDQLLKVLVEGAERFNRGEGRHAKIADAIRKLIVQGVKAAGSIMAYGALAEAHAADLLPGRSEEVTLLTDAGSLRRSLRHPEDPEAFACPPIAGLVSAGGRLLLAAIHHLVNERGGIAAACDTDGAHIVATQKGGTVYVETRGANYYEGGQAQPVHTLSYPKIEDVAALFEPLNPFDPSLLPGSPLRVKATGEGLFISAKRYALSRLDGNFIDRKESILGMFLPPCEGWIDEAWRTIGEMWDHHRPTLRSWFTLPAVRCLSLTSPAYVREMGALAGVRPWNLFLVAIAIGYNPGDPAPKTAIVVAPFERYPEKWAPLDWRFGESGKPIPLDRPDSEGVRWRLRTLKDLLSEYVQNPIAEMLAPDGSPCRGYTRGVLRRRPIRDGERWLILKEAAVWGDDPRHAFSVPAPEKVRGGQSAASTDWNSKIKPALVVVGPTAVARKMGLAERSARAWAAGGRHPENPGQVARAIVSVARDAGLGLPTDEHLRAEEICCELPRRAAAVQCFIVIAVGMLTNATAECVPLRERWREKMDRGSRRLFAGG